MNAELHGRPNLCMQQVTRYSPDPCMLEVTVSEFQLPFPQGQEGLGKMPANETEIVPDLEMGVYESQT